VGELRVEEQAKTKATQQKKEKVEEKPVGEKKVESEVEEKTVSGSYGMSSNNNWKMSLH
jgi:thioredoxin 1